MPAKPTSSFRLLSRTSPLPNELRHIYEQSFPVCEREDWTVHEQGLADGSRIVHVAEVHGRPVGFAITIPLPSVQSALLAYLAVDQAHRNDRLGTFLLTCVRSEVQFRGLARGLYLEVEHATAADPRERRWQERRLAFYARQGADVVADVDYATPDQETGAALPLQLLRIPTGRASAAPRSTSLVEAIYAASYTHSRANAQPVLEQVLASCA